ncbi:hypothetical protein [Nostoc sp. KVJ20]|nr:hypothetical protein [Nostoc sp. KVJ20]
MAVQFCDEVWGTGDWGLAQSFVIPNAQCPIPNAQSPMPNPQ